MHEGDAELLREHEQVDGIVVPDPHLHVLSIQVVDEETPEDLLHRLPETTRPVQPVSPFRQWTAPGKVFPTGPEACSRAVRFARCRPNGPEARRRPRCGRLLVRL